MTLDHGGRHGLFVLVACVMLALAASIAHAADMAATVHKPGAEVHQAALGRVLRFRVVHLLWNAVGVHGGVVPRRHALLLFVPARRDVGVRP